MNIPEEAIDAAMEAILKHGGTPGYVAKRFAKDALEAALPHLEVAIRKQITADIRAEAERMPDRVTQEEVDGMNRAARIAEEGAFHCCAHPKCPGGSICCCPDAEEGNTK